MSTTTDAHHLTIDDGDYEVLPIAVLLVDPAYQRELRERVVKGMLEEGFDMTAAYPILVSERPPLAGMRDPRYYIVDGQHRTRTAERAGESEAICKIVKFRGSEAKIRMQEADLRRKMGERKADTPMERFKSKLAAGNDEALKLDRLVESYGGHISLNPNSRTGLHAISTMERLFRKGKLEQVLIITRKGWDTLDGRAGESSTLDALAWFVTKHEGHFDQGHLTRRMKGMPVETLYARAHAIRAAMGGSLWKNIYRALIEVYNQRAPKAVERLQAVDY